MNHRKIAELAHVSTSTVSKALSGSREVSDDVAEMIRRIALETGYFTQKNKRKAENKRRKEANISIVCPEIISIHYSRIVTLVKSFVEERGGRVAVYIYDFDNNKINSIVEYLSMNKETDGILLISSSKLHHHPSVPMVAFDIYLNDSKYTTIGTMSGKIIDDIVEYLCLLGHTKIGFIGETFTVSKQKFFEEAMKKRGLRVDPDYIYCIENRFEGIGSEAADLIIKSGNLPTAFITAYDEIAISFIYELEKAGINVPEDVSVFGMNDIPSSPYSKSALSTVRFFYDEQAALAVDILYDNIFGDSNDVQHLIIKHELVIRDSTGVPREFL